jgi:hypothetical protein
MAPLIDAVATVILVSSNHLDIGYTDLSSNVINLYFDKFIPAAIATARALRDDGG